MGEESGEVESGGESAGDAVSAARGGVDGIDQAEGRGVEGFGGCFTPITIEGRDSKRRRLGE